MPGTASQHFDEDIGRAEAILTQAKKRGESTPARRLLRDDLLRSAWMFAVAAMDAYFCDAYVSVLTQTLRAKSKQPEVKLPDTIAKIELPVGAVLSYYGACGSPKLRSR